MLRFQAISSFGTRVLSQCSWAASLELVLVLVPSAQAEKYSQVICSSFKSCLERLVHLLVGWSPRATFNIMDSRALIKTDLGSYMRTIWWPLPESLYKTHVRSAYQKRRKTHRIMV